MQKLFAKLTWRLTPGRQALLSFHDEIGIDPERPTIVTPFEATARTHIPTPTMNFGELTHTLSANTLWDVHAGRFVSQRSLRCGKPVTEGWARGRWGTATTTTIAGRSAPVTNDETANR